jgi:preprotein translocase subunit YajC
MSLEAFLAMQNDSTTANPGAAPAASIEAPPQGPPAGAPSGSLTSFLVPMLAIGAIFYFLLYAPERKQRKKREEMLKALKKGDRVMTSGGMFGTVAAIQEKEVTLTVDDNTRIKFARQAIQEVLSNGSSAAPSKS